MSDVADDFYALLEVPPDATQDEIRDAFREKVRVYHPDHNDDPRANAQFTALRKAYDTLGDPVERNAYDRMGHLSYVGKRLDGLPDPGKWAPSETGGAAGGSSGAGSTRSRRGSAGTSGRRSGGSGGSRSTGRGSSASSGGRSRGRRTASDGAGATATRRSRPAHQSPVVSWIARHGLARRLVGWPLLWIAVVVYLAGLVGVAVANLDAATSVVDRLAGGGGLGALDRGAMPTVFDAAADPLLSGAAAGPIAVAGGALFVVGAVLLPAVVALLVYLTRMSPGWQPTYGYVVAMLGPVLGFAVGAAIAPPLAAELGLVLVLPALGLAVMLTSAFVRPRVKAALFG